mmetsp:Transcript_36217/g.62690  ORF Transcript_36217/g.62690 Transcript_36217/m.62690 type:complete len:118 (+) Transcript_36217:205-558(+)
MADPAGLLSEPSICSVSDATNPSSCVDVCLCLFLRVSYHCSGPAKADIRENYHEELYKFLYARSPGGGGTQGEHGGGAAEDSSGGGIAFDDPCWEEFAQDPNDEAWAKWRSGPGAGR